MNGSRRPLVSAFSADHAGGRGTGRLEDVALGSRARIEHIPLGDLPPLEIGSIRVLRRFSSDLE